MKNGLDFLIGLTGIGALGKGIFSLKEAYEKVKSFGDVQNIYNIDLARGAIGGVFVLLGAICLYNSLKGPKK